MRTLNFEFACFLGAPIFKRNTHHLGSENPAQCDQSAYHGGVV